MDCVIMSGFVGAAVGLCAYAVASKRVELGIGTALLALGLYGLMGYLMGGDPTHGGVEGSGATVDDQELLGDLIGGLGAECGWITVICIVGGIIAGLSVADRETTNA